MRSLKGSVTRPIYAQQRLLNWTHSVWELLEDQSAIFLSFTNKIISIRQGGVLIIHEKQHKWTKSAWNDWCYYGISCYQLVIWRFAKCGTYEADLMRRSSVIQSVFQVWVGFLSVYHLVLYNSYSGTKLWTF